MKRRVTSILATVVTLAVSCTVQATSSQYTIQTLSPIEGGRYTSAAFINNDGTVLGQTETPETRTDWNSSTPIVYNVYHACKWHNGSPVDTGMEANPVGLTNSGAAVMRTSTGVVVLGNGATNLGNVGIQCANNVGQYGGTTSPSGGQAIIWTNGVAQPIGSLDSSIGNACVYAINDAGVAAGISKVIRDGKQISHAFKWENNQMTDLGILSGDADSSGIIDINDLGDMVGNSGANPYLWNQSGAHELGILNGYRYSHTRAINHSGQIVGFATQGTGYTRATIWVNGVAVDLNTYLPTGSGWILDCATDINDSGQIVGYGRYNGQNMGFLLTPTPEPSSIVAILGGVAGMAGFGLRRRKAN